MAGHHARITDLKRPREEDGEVRISKMSRQVYTERKNGCQHTKQERNKDMFLNFLNCTSLYNATKTDKGVVDFCKSHGLLPTSVICPNCGEIVEKYYTQRRKDTSELRFQCTCKACGYSRQDTMCVTENTFFEGLKISIQKALVLIYHFITKTTIEQAFIETSGPEYNFEITSPETVMDFFCYCREVCVESLCDCSNLKKKIGGVYLCVEVDVAEFGKRQNSGCRIEEGQCVMGGFCRETNASFYVVLENTEEKTLLKTIEQRIEKGTKIITDCIACHTQLYKMGYGFKDLRLNGHIKSIRLNSEMDFFNKRIDLQWSTLKQALLESSTERNQFGQYLAEYIWRKKHKNKFTIFTDFLHEIAKVFPGPNY